MKLQTNIANNFAISRFNEYYLPSINRHTFENVDSKTFYNQRFKNEFKQQDMLNIVVGMDSGLLANYILEAGIAEGSKFIIVELSCVLPLLLIDIPLKIQKQLYIVDETSLDDLLNQADINLFIAKGQFKLYASSAVSSCHIDDYSTLFNRVETTLQNQHFEQQLNFTQKIYIDSQFNNIADNHTQAKLLRNSFTDNTCLVVAGGPSLDTHIDWIKENQTNLYIIAVSRIAGKLAKLGINVDIVVSVDPQEISFDVSRGMFGLAPNTMLVHSYHINPKILSQWQGNCLYMGQRLPWRDGDIDNVVTIGPTVTNSSVRLAIEMGFTQVLLSGVDFCYSRSGYSHASGSIEANLGPSLGHNTLWVETYAGNQAETPIQLKHALESLEEEARLHPHIKLINLSCDAAKIQGISHSKPQDLILTALGERNIPQISLSIEERRSDLQATQKECEQVKHQLEKLLELINRASSLVSKLNLNAKTSANVHSEIDKIEATINKKYPVLVRLIKTYGFFEFSQFLTTRETQTWTQTQLNEMSKKYYDAFASSCKKVSLLVQNACQKLQDRLDEIEGTPLAALAVKWKQDNQPGRCFIWKNMHPDQMLTVDEQALWSELTQLYHRSLTEINQKFVDKLSSSSTMERIYAKILHLNQAQNHAGLSNIVQNIQPFVAKDPEAKRLYHLALSFQYNLDKQPQQALDALLSLAEDLYTEMELKQIIVLALKLNDLELAETTLSKILAHSDEYMPQYAHILKLRGKIQESVNIYLDYLEKYPADTQTWIKLGLFMVEINQAEGAHTAFSNALNADPDNEVALHYVAELSRIMHSV